jgi:diguanylate cyclase (GGDEF)-like protein
VSAYASALIEMGDCSIEACPAVGEDLKRQLIELSAHLSTDISSAELASASTHVQEQLHEWGKRTSTHYRQKTDEVKELLIVMARAAESVGSRDLRCAGQISEVTSRLREIASLDDLTEIRASIKKSAADLKTSIDRMTIEGRALIDELQKQVICCRARLEEVEELASRDALTGVRSRMNVENRIKDRIAAGTRFCVAMLDIDDFKRVNDQYGHVIGDELLKQFAGELRAVCRSTDVIGRWGGDEFIILLDCAMDEAIGQRDRLRKWVCGNYTIEGSSGPTKLDLNISVGLAEYKPGEAMKALLARADDAMYEHKGISRTSGTSCKR